MNKSNHIILIEDEPSHALLYKYILLTKGYRVTDYRGTDLIVEDLLVENASIQLIVLSVELDQHQSSALYSKIKVLFPGIPVLLLTTALELPNDMKEERSQYLTKPFALDVFLAEVRLLIRSPFPEDYFTQS